MSNNNNNNWKKKEDDQSSSSQPPRDDDNNNDEQRHTPKSQHRSNQPRGQRSSGSGSGSYHKNYNQQRSKGSGSGGGDNYDDRRVNRKAVKKVKELVGYFPDVMIEKVLEQNNYDIQKCVKILNDSKNNSWSSKVLPMVNGGGMDPMLENTGTNEERKKQTQSNKEKKSVGNSSKSSQTNQNTLQNTTTTTTTTVSQNQPIQNTNQNSQTSLPNVMKEEPTLKDFDMFEKNLLDHHSNLTKQTKLVTSLLDEYNSLKVGQTAKIENLKTEKKREEDKRRKIKEEYEQLCLNLKVLDERIQQQEKDLVLELNNIKKKAEQQKLTFSTGPVS